MKGLQLCYLSIVLRFITAQASNSNVFRSNPGSYLKGHVFTTQSVLGLHHCITACLGVPNACKSCNFNFMNKTCELNYADRFSSHGHLVAKDGFSYCGWKYPQRQKMYTSCADILKDSRPFSCPQNGYYNIVVRGKKRRLYCDMTNFGGGWTLVSSVNASNNDHLQSIEHNCRDDDVCVEYTGNTASQARKLSDQDIRALVSEGTYRGDVIGSSPFSVFFQFPSGNQSFNSNCNKAGEQECPRIITSHHYPYQWESNCKGIKVGYKLHDKRFRVFDNFDNKECNSVRWSSSMAEKYANRFLYGYVDGSNTGIYRGRNGFLFVK